MPEEVALPAARRERRDATSLFILAAFLGLTAGLAAVGLICWGLFPGAANHTLMAYPTPSYPAPQLQASPHQDMVRFYQAEMQRLDSAGWVDRDRGIVHIPIEDAMRKLAASGIAGWPTTASGHPSASGSHP